MERNESEKEGKKEKSRRFMKRDESKIDGKKRKFNGTDLCVKRKNGSHENI